MFFILYIAMLVGNLYRWLRLDKASEVLLYQPEFYALVIEKKISLYCIMNMTRDSILVPI